MPYSHRKVQRSQGFFDHVLCACSAATEQELSYYVSGDALSVIENESYVFAGLAKPFYTKNGDTVTANVAVQYLDQRTGMTQVSQFVVELKKSDRNWKII